MTQIKQINTERQQSTKATSNTVIAREEQLYNYKLKNMKTTNNAVITREVRPEQSVTTNTFSDGDCFLLCASQFAMTAKGERFRSFVPSFFCVHFQLSINTKDNPSL
jgi:hypothetical protein